MLEVYNLTKVYKPKRGVAVKAVDHVNLKFPETGMIFLLGKSGSGKSTMLNLLGGLDVYDEGEIIIKGKSSKNFKQKDFDSYRNTYLGFIFQEYNILNDFNVGANIALALKLQGQKATDERINEILAQVDLEGFGLRKPNELSGGQKQRVAIARALVKNPEIIMADEPTGALDSVTGRQVLDTLKKLSSDKLVIVVSHDREFAEQYADRIIELADGHVISDMEYFGQAQSDDSQDQPEMTESEETADLSLGGGLTFYENTVQIAPAYHLTEGDRIAINRWIDGHRNDAALTMDLAQGLAPERKRAFAGRKCAPTDESKIVASNSEPFHLIKSRLPLKYAFTMGASGLKHKKFRLVVTIILSFLAYTLFGFADTMANYNYVTAAASSIQDSNITYASFQKNETFGSGILSYSQSVNMDQEGMEKIKENTGVDVTGVVDLSSMDNDFSAQYKSDDSSLTSLLSSYASHFSGMITLNQDMAEKAGLDLIAGRFADGSKNEMVISEYLAYTFMLFGYRAPDVTDDTYETISTEADMVGKVIRVCGIDMEVVGVVDTGFDFDRYSLKVSLDPEKMAANAVLSYVLSSELESYQNYSFICMMMVGDGFIENTLQNSINGLYNGMGGNVTYNENLNYYYGMMPMIINRLSEVDTSDIVWLDGEKDSLSQTEVIVDEETLLTMYLECGGEITEETTSLPENLVEKTKELTLDKTISMDTEEESSTIEGCRIVGYRKAGTCEEGTFIVDDATYETIKESSTGTYAFALGIMPEKYSQICDVVEFSHNKSGKYQYTLQNSAMYEVDLLDELFKILSKFFLGLGIFFAIFASILMATFISSSISYKRKEIGILRAIGARGSDVFRIFFSESFIIAMINFVLSASATAVACAFINRLLRQKADLLVTVLHFGIRQVGLLLLISLGVAAVASFLPVCINAAKKPIDVIREK